MYPQNNRKNPRHNSEFEFMMTYAINLAESCISSSWWVDDAVEFIHQNPTKKRLELIDDFNKNKLFEFQLILLAGKQELINNVKVLFENNVELNMIIKSVLSSLYPKRLLNKNFDIAEEVLFLTNEFDNRD